MSFNGPVTGREECRYGGHIMPCIAKQSVRRRSVRKYDMGRLPEDVLQTLEDFIETIVPPFGGKFGFRILDKEEYDKRSGGMFNVSAPHYLMFFGEKEDDGLLKDIGFIGELAVLKLTEMNIGTCWLGGPKSKETLGGSEYIICICFGRSLEEFRKSEEEADRKDMKDIAENCSPEQKELLKSVRLAPSARNLQPWFFRCDENKIHVFRKSKGVLTKLAIFKMMQKIDIGIAISHFTAKKFTVEKLHHTGNDMLYECTLVFSDR
jgi:nitroreductase